MHRRSALALLGGGAAALAGCAPFPGLTHDSAPDSAPDSPPAGLSTRGRLFIPGYDTAAARIGGAPARDRLDAAARARPGDSTLLTRVDPDGGITRAIFPITGHDVAISADGRLGFFGRMGAGEEGAAHHLAFDPATLEEVGRGLAPGRGWRGGGHGVHLPDGSAVLTAERAPLRGWTGRAETHHGRIAFRDPQTLRIIDSVSCHGIDPHELRLLPGGRQVAVANYGSVPPPGSQALGLPRHVAEASLTVVDLDSGALVARRLSPDPGVELRHLALTGAGGVFAIRVRLAPAGADARWTGSGPHPGPDRSADPGEAYLPAAPLLFPDPAAEAIVCATAAEADAQRHGLSVEFDPVADEILATFPSSHRVMAFDPATGRVRRQIDMAALGLPFPCGLALLPDGQTYAVAGRDRGLAVLRRGSHRLVSRARIRLPIHGHSHMTAG